MTAQPVRHWISKHLRIMPAALAAGVLACAAWLCLQPPPRTMRLVARVPCAEMFQCWSGNNYGLSAYRTGCYLAFSEIMATTGCRTLTFIDWEGRPSWRVTLPWHDPPLRPGEGCVCECGSRAVLSPDGHILAVSVPNGKTMRIMSWRDGRLLGTANVPWSPPPAFNPQHYYICTYLLATDSGRVWLYHTGSAACRLYAVDGAHVASGTEMVNPAATAMEYNYDLSPDGQVLIERDSHQTLVYATLQVHDTRVVATRRYTTLINDCRFLTWSKPGEALTDGRWNSNNAVNPQQGTCIGPNGVTAVALDGWRSGFGEYGPATLQCRDASTRPAPPFPERWRVYLPPPAHSWEVPVHSDKQTNAYMVPGGSAVLIGEDHGYNQFSGILATLQQYIPAMHVLTRHPTRLEVFTAPGHLSALLALPGTRMYPSLGDGVSDSLFLQGLSPDGHRVAIYAQLPRSNKGELRLYAW